MDVNRMNFWELAQHKISRVVQHRAGFSVEENSFIVRRAMGKGRAHPLDFSFQRFVSLAGLAKPAMPHI